MVDAFPVGKSLCRTMQRSLVPDAYSKREGHIRAEKLYGIAGKRNRLTRLVATHRFQKLPGEAGLPQERISGGRRRRAQWTSLCHRHREHPGCRSCIPVVGVFDPVIEELRQCLATRSGFVLPAVGCIRAVRAKEHGRRKSGLSDNDNDSRNGYHGRPAASLHPAPVGPPADFRLQQAGRHPLKRQRGGTPGFPVAVESALYGTDSRARVFRMSVFFSLPVERKKKARRERQEELPL